jgi:hypothetical protein
VVREIELTNSDLELLYHICRVADEDIQEAVFEPVAAKYHTIVRTQVDNVEQETVSIYPTVKVRRVPWAKEIKQIAGRLCRTGLVATQPAENVFRNDHPLPREGDGAWYYITEPGVQRVRREQNYGELGRCISDDGLIVDWSKVDTAVADGGRVDLDEWFAEKRLEDRDREPERMKFLAESGKRFSLEEIERAVAYSLSYLSQEQFAIKKVLNEPPVIVYDVTYHGDEKDVEGRKRVHGRYKIVQMADGTVRHHFESNYMPLWEGVNKMVYVELRDNGTPKTVVTKQPDLVAPSKTITGEKSNLQTKPAGRPPDKINNEAYQKLLEKSESQAFDFWCEKKNIDNPTRKDRQNFKQSMKRAKNRNSMTT